MPSVSESNSPGAAAASDAAGAYTPEQQGSCAPFPVGQVDEGDMFCLPDSSKDEDEDEPFDNMIPDFKVEADDDNNQINSSSDINEEVMKRAKPEPTPFNRTIDKTNAISEAQATGIYSR